MKFFVLGSLFWFVYRANDRLCVYVCVCVCECVLCDHVDRKIERFFVVQNVVYIMCFLVLVCVSKVLSCVQIEFA